MTSVTIDAERKLENAGNLDRCSAVEMAGEGRWEARTHDHKSSSGVERGMVRAHTGAGSPPRARRPPREVRRVSLAHAPTYVQLNQYRLLEPIGQGSYGIVKLAYSEEDDTHYAMKILSKRKLMRRAGLFGRAPPRRGSPGGPGVRTPSVKMDPLQRIYREIAVLKKLDHPNVVKLVEVLDDPEEDQLYLVFQLLEGGPVTTVPNDDPLSEDLARKYFRDVLLGIEYLHYQRIAHRDIKPANLLLGDDRVQVADLGASGELAVGGEVVGGGGVGTPAFRAPEAFATDKYDAQAADIWSLGVTLFAMVTGRVPWVGASVVELHRRILSTPLTLPPRSRLTPHLVDLLTRMLDKDPITRAHMAEIKEHPWVTCNGTQPLPSEQDNCRLVEVTEDDVARVVTSIPNLSTLILIKTMLKKHSFQNPFLRSREGSAARREGAVVDGAGASGGAADGRRGLARAGRSLSAPGSYHTDREVSFDLSLESVEESRDQSREAQSGDGSVAPASER